jgi:hypothetical protein
MPERQERQLRPRSRSERFDVVVAGGGCAGVAAAVAAAQAGARTLLVERTPRLGGNAANAFVHTICGLYLAADAGDAVPAHPGFPSHFAHALRAAGAAGEPERAGRVWVLPTEPARIPAVAAGLCAEAPGLELRLEAELRGAALGAGASEPHQLEVACGERMVRIASHVLIDTTGDACAAALAGAAIETPPRGEVQIPSFIFRLAGVDAAALEGFGKLRLTHAVAGAVRAGALPAGCESVLVRPGGAPGHAYVTLNLPRQGARPFEPLDPAQVAELEQVARARAEAVAAFLRATRPAFAASRIDAFPHRLGIRESRRVEGCETVTGEDVLAGRRRSDEVAVSTWPIELWQDHRRARFEYGKDACSVPLGALVARSHPRLGMAGRCASGSREALGALRVIGTALATGEAIGVAAALAAGAGTGLDAIAAPAVRDHIAERARARGLE